MGRRAKARVFSLPAFAYTTRNASPFEGREQVQLWQPLLQEAFLITSPLPGSQVLVSCWFPLPRPMPSQSQQLGNVETRRNEGVDNPGPAGAPGPASLASHPASWQLPCPPRGTRLAPQGSGQLRVPSMGGGGLPKAGSGQTWCRDGDQQNPGGRELPAQQCSQLRLLEGLLGTMG